MGEREHLTRADKALKVFAALQEDWPACKGYMHLGRRSDCRQRFQPWTFSFGSSIRRVTTARQSILCPRCMLKYLKIKRRRGKAAELQRRQCYKAIEEQPWLT